MILFLYVNLAVSRFSLFINLSQFFVLLRHILRIHEDNTNIKYNSV